MFKVSGSNVQSLRLKSVKFPKLTLYYVSVEKLKFVTLKFAALVFKVCGSCIYLVFHCSCSEQGVEEDREEELYPRNQ